MKQIHPLFVLGIFICAVILAAKLYLREKPTNDPIINFVREHIRGSRRRTFTTAIELSNKHNVRTIVETGTARGGNLAYNGDGGFTIIFGLWSQLHNAELFSVDIAPEAVEKARDVTAQFGNNVHVVQNDSVDFLKNFDRSIDFLYLDSFDFDKNNPDPSQLHHLHEIEAAYDKLSPHSIVMIDDCGLPYGGKEKLVVNYLVSKGWTIYAQDYQIILVHC